MKQTPPYTFQDTSPDIPLKQFWSDNEHFADLFNSCLFNGKEVLKPHFLKDLNPDVSISIFSKEFQKTIRRTRDVLKAADTGECYRILGIEDQQAIHYAMPLRCLIYDGLTYLSQIEKTANGHKHKQDIANLDEFLSKYTKRDKLFPCYTIVIYWGEKRWDGPRKLSEMTAFGINDLAQEWFNDYHMHLLCVNEMEHPQTKSADVFKLFTAVRELYTNGGENLPDVLSDVSIEVAYLASLVTKTTKNYEKLINQARADRKESINMCEAAERLQKKCMEAGRLEGINHVALKMLYAGKPDEEILEFTEITKEALCNLKKQGIESLSSSKE